MDYEENLRAIKERMAAACLRAGRPVDSVSLMGVTKGQPAQAISAMAGLGVKLFGENKVQEAKAKLPLCPSRLIWHMIGHLQSNKCRDAVHLFDMIEGVDSLSLAEELEKCAKNKGKIQKILLEVNVAGEASKFGMRAGDVESTLMKVNDRPHLEIHGLMTIAPYSPDPERARGCFRRLRELKEKCEQTLGAPLAELSMGMSGDFEVAIEEGATIVRIGTALFGARPKLSAVKSSEED